MQTDLYALFDGTWYCRACNHGIVTVTGKLDVEGHRNTCVIKNLIDEGIINDKRPETQSDKT